MSTITIDSIIGGQSPTTHFNGKGQFRASLGIDPAQPIDDADSKFSSIASGLLRPVAAQNFTSSTIAKAPLWMNTTPKDSNVYVYDAQSSAYSIAAGFTSATALSDAGTLSGNGNGAAYYDNYQYFATGTDIARYGPLNGAPGFNGTYWTGTLSKAALTNTTYPTDFLNGIKYPNHPMHRHSDGKLYFGDVSGNQGIINKISTTKTSVEGDTDSSSALAALTFGYGLWPMDIETYNSNLAIALFEGSSTNIRQTKAKLAFWDTTSTNFNTIIWVEYPDSLITALRNVNGVLYVFSGNYHAAGFRVTKFSGSYSFTEVFYSETGQPPFAGAVDAILNRILLGTYTTVPEPAGCVYSVGLQKAALGQGIFNVARTTGPSITGVTSICTANNDELGFYAPIVGWAGDGQYGIDKQGTAYNNAPSVWWSPTYRIGMPFLINAIRIPFAQAIAANMTLQATIYTDDGSTSTALQIINSTTMPNGERATKGWRNLGIRGTNNFWLELKWSGSALLTVALPILIDYAPVPDL